MGSLCLLVARCASLAPDQTSAAEQPVADSTQSTTKNHQPSRHSIGKDFNGRRAISLLGNTLASRSDRARTERSTRYVDQRRKPNSISSQLTFSPVKLGSWRRFHSLPHPSCGDEKALQRLSQLDEIRSVVPVEIAVQRSGSHFVEEPYD
ncbi:hypothetical protein IWZ01DRAFT_487055 [Phyllosticta capitalensis]